MAHHEKDEPQYDTRMYPNHEIYAVMDAAADARDALVIAMKRLADCQVGLHDVGQSPEVRQHGITNAHLLEFHRQISEIEEHAHAAHEGVLEATRKGRAFFDRYFTFSAPNVPREDDVEGCNC